MQDKIHFDLGLITKNKLFLDHKTKEREKEMVTQLFLDNKKIYPQIDTSAYSHSLSQDIFTVTTYHDPLFFFQHLSPRVRVVHVLKLYLDEAWITIRED
jgi:hypothetical protein